MALLFPRDENCDKQFAGTTDAATRSLSAISLETSFVEGVYEKLASVYDVFFGLSLQPASSASAAASIGEYFIAIPPSPDQLPMGLLRPGAERDQPFSMNRSTCARKARVLAGR